MVLSKRLEVVASMIPPHRNVIDIGCDHGLLDIYLAQTREDIHVLGTDISASSIETTQRRAHPLLLPNLTFQVADGLKKVSLQEEVLVLTGMGAHTILDILRGKDLRKNLLIVSAHRNVDLLRKEMVQNGFYIKDEKAVFDKKWYVIIVFAKGKKTYKEEDFLLGPFTKNNKEYMYDLYQKEKKITQKKGAITPLLTVLEKYQ